MSLIPDIFRNIEPAGVRIYTGTVPVEIADLYPVLQSVTLQVGRSQPGAGHLVLTLGRNEIGIWPVLDGGYFERWKPIRIAADFGSYAEDVLWGNIVKIAPEYPQDRGAAKVTIEVQDQTIAMDRQQQTRNWGDSESPQPITDRLIAQSIAATYGLRLALDCGEGQRSQVLVQDKTDFAFLKERAEAVGYEFRVLMGEVYFGPLRLQGAPQPEILVYAGPDSNCLSFQIDEEAAVPDRAVTAAVDTKGDGKASETQLSPDLPILGTRSLAASGAASGLPENVIRLRQEGDRAPEAGRMLAQAKINEASLAIKAEALIDSTLYGHVLLPGKLVRIDGVGLRYGGRYYVDSVEHVFDATGYRQKAALLKNGIEEI